MSSQQWTFTVPGRPRPKGRPRLAWGRHGAAIYTPPETVAYEQSVGWHARAAGVRPLEGPVELVIRCYLAGPGDADNLAKSICDGLTGVAYEDDRQVRRLVVEVRRVRRDDERAEITIRPWGDEA